MFKRTIQLIAVILFCGLLLSPASIGAWFEGSANVTMTANPVTCQISPETGRCSTRLDITNPDGIALQVLVRGIDGQEKQLTGVTNEKTFSADFPWIRIGTTLFTLMDVQANTVVTTLTVTGTNGVQPTLSADPASCKVIGGPCSTTLTALNPGRLLIQITVTGPDGMENALTAATTEDRIIAQIPWIGVGTYTFILYDVNQTPRRELVRTSVKGTTIPTIQSFTATPSSVGMGMSTVLSWQVTGAVSCALDQGIGNVDCSASRTVSPSQTTTYILTAQNEVGPASAQVVVNVVSTAAPGVLHSTDSIVGNLRYVPAGVFSQGAPPAEICSYDSHAPFQHILSRHLAVMETEVTQQAWAQLKAAQPSLIADPTNIQFGYWPANPVQNINWHQTVLFANLLSLQQGLTQAYYKDSAFTIPVNADNYSEEPVFCNFDANGYRLPSEGEWEYITRAGTTEPFSVAEPSYNPNSCSSCVANLLKGLETAAWFCSNARGVTHAVGEKVANPWNLKDVHGNVSEWCWDWYTAEYPATEQMDYSGPISGVTRVVRGGSWNDSPRLLRSAYRASFGPSYHAGDLGFRLVRSIIVTTPQKPFASISVNPTTIVQGQFASLSWTVSGADTCSLNEGIGTVNCNGARVVTPNSTTTYVITAENSQGTSTASAVLTVTTQQAPEIQSLTASPTSIQAGQSAVLSWSATGADSCSLDQGIGTVNCVGVRTVFPNTTTTYKLTATNSVGTVTKQVTVSVFTDQLPTVTTFTVYPMTIYNGQSALLSWSTQNATACSIDQGIGNVECNGNRSVTPSSSMAYTLSATNSKGTVTASVTITVNTLNLPTIVSFQANPSTISIGQNSILSWNVTGADTCILDQGIGTVNCVDTRTVAPQSTKTYTLTAINTAGSSTAQATVNVGSTITAGSLLLTDGLVGNLRYIPAGTFQQGTPVGEIGRMTDEGPPFQHSFTGDKAVMETEVTQKMWADLQALQPGLPQMPTCTGAASASAHPVQCVSWHQAVLFANLLSLQQGLERVYFKDTEYTLPLDGNNFQTGTTYMKWSANGYRLPTEGEWEYVARAQTSGAFPYDEPNYNAGTYNSCSIDASSILNKTAWYCANSYASVHPVGEKQANPWGIKDMQGNVWEWCSDWYGIYPNMAQTDYHGPVAGASRVIRGGGWNSVPQFLRSGYRYFINPNQSNNVLGFRLLRMAGKPTITSLAVNPASIYQGWSSDLTWSVRDATVCSINQGIGVVDCHGSLTINPETTTTYTLTAANGIGAVTSTVTLTVKPLTNPDIQTFTASPTTITLGESATLSWNVPNATSCSINGGVGLVGCIGVKTVSPVMTTTYVLTATNRVGTTTGQVTVTVIIPSPPTISAFTANPVSISPGGSSVLSWSVSNASTCTINQGIGAVNCNGTRTVYPTSTATYILTAVNVAGTVTRQVTITVVTPVPPAITSFTATPSVISSGQSSTLAWSTTNAVTCTIDPGIGAVPCNGTLVVTPTATTTYTLMVVNLPWGSNSSTTVTIITSGLPTINSFSASPASVVAGGSSQLSWNVANAVTCSINQGIGAVSCTGSMSVSPTTTRTYTLTATNPNGSRTADATVTVTSALSPVISSFAASPTAINAGGSSTLSWAVTNAASCSIDQGIGTVSCTGGSRVVNPTTTTTYTLTATNAYGTVTSAVTVTVASGNSPIINSFTASPDSIASGTSSTLYWNVSNATSCSINQGIGIVACSGSRTVTPTATTSYTLTATNGINTVSSIATVTVTSATTLPVIGYFGTNFLTVYPGQPNQLRWNVSNATSCSIDNGIGTVDCIGVRSITTYETTTYTLTATNGYGGTTASLTITVDITQIPPVVNSFSANPTSIYQGQSSTLTWTTSNATSCSISGIGTVACNGSQAVAPVTETTYVLTATNSLTSVTGSVTISVYPFGINSFTATPSTVSSGQTSTLSWVLVNPVTCTITPGPINCLSATSTIVGPLTATTTYTMTVTNGASASVSRQVTVTVVPVPVGGIPSGTLYGSPDSIVGNLRYVRSANFNQGSPTDEAGRGSDGSNETLFQHNLSQDIAVMETEVTQKMWNDLRAVQSSLTDKSSAFTPVGNSYPANSITWGEAALFANLLSLQQSLTRAYYADSGFTTPVTAASINVYCKWDANGYRLPSEGEWEFFTRAGTTGVFSVTEPAYNSTNMNCPAAGTLTALESVAWFCSNAGDAAHAVAGKAANPWNLYDVHGNILEWVWDWWQAAYPVGTQVDYHGPTATGSRVLRGGSYEFYASAGYAKELRSAARYHYDPSLQTPQFGFRLVKNVNRPTVTSFTASPTTISTGESTTLAWSFDPAEVVGCNIVPGNINCKTVWSQLVTGLTNTTTFTLTAVDSYGVAQTVQRTVTVIPAPVITVFSAASPTVPYNHAGVLTWSTSNATSCNINGTPVACIGSTSTGSLTANTTFTLSASNSIGTTVISSLTVYVVPDIVSFTTNSTVYEPGETATLTWQVNTTAGTTCSIDRGIGTVACASGSVAVYPDSSTTYTLTAANSSGTVTQTVTAQILRVASFTASPDSITSGGSSTLTWNVVNALSCSITSNMGTHACTVGSSSVVVNGITSTTTFTLTAVNESRSTQAAVTVTVPVTTYSAGQLFSTDSIVGAMRFVPAGSYTQGSPIGEPGRDATEGPQFVHTLTRNLAVMQTEVTQKMWADLQGLRAALPAEEQVPMVGFTTSGDNHPVDRATWRQVTLFANLLSKQNLLTPAYYSDAAFTTVATAGSVNIYMNWNADGYRLPTEGEWEYFARAGTASATYPYFSIAEPNYASLGNYTTCPGGGTLNTLEQYAWFCSNNTGIYQPVGGKLTNPWGLYDIHGNVAEWVYDTWYASYPTSARVDYFDESMVPTYYKTWRGGYNGLATDFLPARIRSAFRYRSSDTAAEAYVGFRLVRTAPTNPVILTFTSSPATIFPGSATTLSWNATNAITCNLNGIETIPCSGTRVVHPDTTTTYTVTAANNTGVTSTSTTVTVTAIATGSTYASDTYVRDLIYIPDGTFTQGSPASEVGRFADEDQFIHKLNRKLAVMKMEVTRQMWIDLYNAVTPGTLPTDPSNTTYSPLVTHPVQSVTWRQAVLFANVLSVKQGLTPAYYTSAAFTTPIDASNYNAGSVYCNWNASGYRLPSEGEWEYIARAGTFGPFSVNEPAYSLSTYNQCTAGLLPVLEGVAWFCGNASGTTHPVGLKTSNPWNFKDIHGNVNELVWDVHHAYPVTAQINYQYPNVGVGVGLTDTPVIRGGDWEYQAVYARSAYRDHLTSGTVGDRDVGFRLVRTLTTP